MPNRWQPMSNKFGRIAQSQLAILLLLLVTLLKGIAWSTIVPPFHAPDEQYHFLYAQGVERLQNWRVPATKDIPTEVDLLNFLIQYNRVHNGQWLDLTDTANINLQLARLSEETTKRNLTPNSSAIRLTTFNSFHPPLYYALTGMVQAPLENLSIQVRLLASRWLAVFFGVLTVAIAYRFGLELWGSSSWALLTASFVSFLPMQTFITSVLSNGALETLWFSACLLVSLFVIRHGMSRTRSVALGFIVGCGLITKTSFLSVFLLMAMLWGFGVIRQVRARRWSWSTQMGWVVVAGVCLAMAGWWYGTGLAKPMTSPLGAVATKSLSESTNLMVFLVQYDWLSNYRPILEMYWGNFGWLDTPLPVSLTLGLSWLTVIGVWSTLWWFVRRLALRSDPLSLFPLFFCGCATLGIIAFYAYLTFLIPYWGMQGRYMLPAVTAQMAWLLFGLVLPAPGNLRRAWMWIINTGMVVLNLFVLFSLLPLRYYGARNWLLLSDRATVLQPLEPTTLLVIFVVVVGLVALFLVTCALTLAQDPSVDLPSAE